MLLTSFEERTVFWLLKHIDGIQTGLGTSRLLEQNKNYMSTTDVLVHTDDAQLEFENSFQKLLHFGREVELY